MCGFISPFPNSFNILRAGQTLAASKDNNYIPGTRFGHGHNSEKGIKRMNNCEPKVLRHNHYWKMFNE